MNNTHLIYKGIVVLLLMLISACSSTEKPSGIVDSNTMLIIEKANEIAPQPIQGEFVLTIRNADTVNRNVYLNTQSDYRDQRAVTVVIPSNYVRALTQMHGEHPQQYFNGKRIEVRGAAKRVKINFYSANGQESDKYYYQTHILLDRPEYIKVIPTV